jgi:hypothetical protein
MAQLPQEESGEASDQFTYASLGPSTGDIAQLVERRPCKWVVALTENLLVTTQESLICTRYQSGHFKEGKNLDL